MKALNGGFVPPNDAIYACLYSTKDNLNPVEPWGTLYQLCYIIVERVCTCFNMKFMAA